VSGHAAEDAHCWSIPAAWPDVYSAGAGARPAEDSGDAGRGQRARARRAAAAVPSASH